ncbi:VTT domain-containing protein [Carboxydothermus pertinax]|uniref:Membrane protein n=1 Tax=Carboxydothermus pertinax TaxID=870242 RepID=A0A1L8CWY8_9THEO|nr:VTT domain-containing protein [Carboxydothermus pertinax]GAV23432.1 membrane protein [Carboxydothermus pertinax]
MNLLWDLFFHLDQHLDLLLQRFGFEAYLILFFIIFAETGFVVTPFLPGDSLLFATGALAATGSLNIIILIILFITAAITGNTINYFIARSIGLKILTKNQRIIKKEHLQKTENFYAKYGPITIILARFVPIVRTFAPFVAGIGRMNLAKFWFYNFIGAFSWVVLITLTGYFFGNIPVVKNNFSLVVLGIIFVSLLPAFIGLFKRRN